MYLKEAMWGQRAHLFICTRAEKEKAFPCFSVFLVRDRPLLTFNTLMGKESEQNSKMEMVINMLMLGRGAGKSSFYTRPSAIYWRVCACMCECVWRGKTEIEKEQEQERTGNVHAHVRAHTHTHTHGVQSKQERAACERATFLFQSAFGDSAKGLLLAHWWDKKRGGGWGAFRHSQSQLFFYRMEAPHSMGTHLPCCVIVAHNGAHLIQAAQGFFSKAIFSIHSQASHVLERYYAPLWAQGHHIFAFEWNVLCNQDKILLSAYYKRCAVKQFDICHLTFYSHSSLDINKVADLSRLGCYTSLCRGVLAINSGFWQTLAWK